MPPRPSDPSDSYEVKSYQGYRIGFTDTGDDAQLVRLIDQLRQSTKFEPDPLNGRAMARTIKFPEWGNVVIKSYVRGGWMKYISHRNHLRNRTSRAAREFHLLRQLHAEGFPVPKPLAWAERGTVFVHNWLILTEVPDSQTLAQVVRIDPDRAHELLPSVRHLIQRLITRRIHHVDLHPGNVLVDARNQVYLIDFDKGSESTFSAPDLWERYHRRWNRAVTKHRLPAALRFSLRSLQPTQSGQTSQIPHGTLCLTFLAEWDPLISTLLH